MDLRKVKDGAILQFSDYDSIFRISQHDGSFESIGKLGFWVAREMNKHCADEIKRFAEENGYSDIAILDGGRIIEILKEYEGRFGTCDFCEPGSYVNIYGSRISENFDHKGCEANFCPHCGRRLKKEEKA